MPQFDPDEQRRFAVEVVQKLRAAGHQAYWAGGCVRDQLLGCTPKDYDVATSAAPEQIREVFGRRRTVAVGAAFGVITVLGPSRAGQIEVATFRRDAAYSDGRHPDFVVFSGPQEDAARRDFTINGLFLDPVEDRLIDFVGGRNDLALRVIRAIGNPQERFEEDKLRLLRAVRFAAAFDFEIEMETLAAIRQMASEIVVVSPERIADEMRKMLVLENRLRAVQLVVATGLANAFLPEILPADGRERQFEEALRVLDGLESPEFPLALAALLYPFLSPAASERICRRWRLSNRETERTCWLVEHHAALRAARATRWSKLQRLLIADGARDLLALSAARAKLGIGDLDDVLWCREQLEQSVDKLNPPPLLTGDDLLRHGVRAGPKYKELLDRIRDAQLDGEIRSKDEALELVDRIGNRE